MNRDTDPDFETRNTVSEARSSPERAQDSETDSIFEEERFPLPLTKNPANIEIFDLLEGALRRMHKREDPSELMYALRHQMGSAFIMFQQDRLTLQKMGMHHLDAFLFALLPDITRYLEHYEFGKHPRVGRLEEAARYVVTHFVYLRHERFYLYCVNTRGTLKSDIMLNKGIEDRALLSIRDLMIEVMRAEPAGIIVAHNHPNYTMRPSSADLQCTINIINSLKVLNVPLLDHLIVAGRNVISIRENGFISEQIWMNQNPKNHLLRDWFLPAKTAADVKHKVYTPEEKRAWIERQMRIRRNKRKRSMEELISLHRHHTYYAKRYLEKYEKVRSRDEYMQREDVLRANERKINRFMRRYTIIYKMMLEAKEREKQQRKLQRKQKAKKPKED